MFAPKSWHGSNVFALIEVSFRIRQNVQPRRSMLNFACCTDCRIPGILLRRDNRNVVRRF